MQGAYTIREVYAEVYPITEESPENSFWQRTLRALEELLPARIAVSQ